MAEILTDLAFTSTGTIGDAVISGTGHSFDSSGFQSGGAGSCLTFDSTIGDPLVPTITDIDEDCILTFEIPTADILALDGTEGNAGQYPLMWRATGITTPKYMRLLGSGANWVAISFRVNGSPAIFSDLIYFSRNVSRGTNIRFDISIDPKWIDVWVDKCHLGHIPNEETVTSTIFERVYFGGYISTYGFEGRVGNLRVTNSRLLLMPTAGYEIISTAGDSTGATGNWDGTGDDGWIKGTDTTVADGSYYDNGTTPTIHRELAKVGINSRVLNYCISTTTVIESGTLDIMDQVDGTGANDALEYLPNWLVFDGIGYNDMNSGNPDTSEGGTFELAVQALVDKVFERSPNTKVLLVNTYTRENSTSFNGAANMAETDAVNARIADVAAGTANCELLDIFTLWGGHLSYDTTFFNTNDFHPSEIGSNDKGKQIATRLRALA